MGTITVGTENSTSIDLYYEDRILPPDATSRRQAKMIKHVRFAEIAGGPHGLCWTHADRVNAELVPFVE